MNISQVITKLKALMYSKSETDSLLGGKANSSHTHTKSQITDFPAYGSTAGTICQGNDPRLSDARTPYFANGTWYVVGDDAAIGDHNVGGGVRSKSIKQYHYPYRSLLQRRCC